MDKSFERYLFLEKNEYIVVSNSMYPTIKKGDKVKILKVDYKNIKSGDIVVYKKNGKLIVHRLVFQKNFLALTKGDNRVDFDEPISVFDIVGKVEGKSSKKLLIWFFIKNKLRKIKNFFIKRR